MSDKNKLRDEVKDAIESIMKMEGNFDEKIEGMIIMYGNRNDDRFIAALMGDTDTLHNTLLNTMFKNKFASQLVINCANEYVKLKLFECDDEGCICKKCESKRQDIKRLSAGEGEEIQRTGFIETNPKNIN